MRKIHPLLASLLILSTAFCASSQKRINQKSDRGAQHQYDKAVIAMKYGLADQALVYVNEALSLSPRHYQALHLLGMIKLEKRNFTEAVDAFEKCLEVKPDFAEARAYLGTAFQEMGDKEKAEAEYLKSFSVDGNAYSAFYLAKLKFEKKQLEPALDFIEKSIQKSGDQATAAAHNVKGVILNEMGRYPEAVSTFEKASRLNPADAQMSINLGVAYANDKQTDKACAIFEKTLPLIKDPALKGKIEGYLKMLKDAPEQTTP